MKRVSLVPVTRDTEGNNVRLVTPDSDDGIRLYNKLRELSPDTALTMKGQEMILLDNL